VVFQRMEADDVLVEVCDTCSGHRAA